MDNELHKADPNNGQLRISTWFRSEFIVDSKRMYKSKYYLNPHYLNKRACVCT